MDPSALRPLADASPEIPTPVAPQTVEQTGLDPHFLLRFVLKSAYVTHRGTAPDLAEYTALATGVVSELLEEAKQMRLVEVLGLADPRRSVYRYALTGVGRDWALEALNQCQYTGPAPVSLDAYRAQVAAQTIRRDAITPERMAEVLTGLVLPEGTVERLGPAANSARSLLLYGAPGNGKTSIALALGTAFAQAIYLPHCLEADGQILRFFDPSVHRPVEPSEPHDPRWVRCHRPVVLTGGELSMEMLDLSFDPVAKFYEAPAHLKATGGVFVADDLGRQRVAALDLVNRWILPLEHGIDFLTLHTGKKIQMPFDQLVIFSTNSSPRELIDSAGLRRIPYKFQVHVPTRDQYERILARACQDAQLALPANVPRYLLERFYPETGVPISAAHPRFIVDHVLERCRFERSEPRLTLERVHDAVENLVIGDEPPPLGRR